jgi:hypothetical protein
MTEKTKPRNDLLLRLGDIQLLTFWEGEGVRMVPRAQIVKILPEDSDPKGAVTFSMEDLAALEHLCREAREAAIKRQSIDLAASAAATLRNQAPPMNNEDRK